MGTIDARPAPATDWGARSIGTVWRAFDLQIATYAALLTGFGLAMAYSNTVAGGTEALVPGSVFLRGLLWTSIALTAFVLATAFDYRWLKTFAWPLYVLQLGLLGGTLAFGTGVGGSSRWVSLLGLQFQFSELAKILMIVILANYMASRHGRMGSLWSILGACALTGPPLVLVLLQPDLGTSLVFGAVLVGMLFISGASLRWLGALALAVVAALPFIWTYVLR
ncbi:MAG: FtsW/RodA/SpoVE family cell cycle protein, partial [Dehalococcoidia bacterium]